MAHIDTWTDDTVERAIHLIRLGEAVVRELRRTYVPTGRGIRAVTVDRWLADAVEFLEQNPIQEEEEEHATAEAH
jgi:hypothetical protein